MARPARLPISSADTVRPEPFPVAEGAKIVAVECSILEKRSTFNVQRPTLDIQTFNVQRSTFNVQRSTFNAQRSTLNVPTFNAQRSTLNVQRSTFNAQRSTLNVQRSTLNVQRSTFNAQRPTLNSGRQVKALHGGSPAHKSPIIGRCHRLNHCQIVESVETLQTRKQLRIAGRALRNNAFATLTYQDPEHIRLKRTPIRRFDQNRAHLVPAHNIDPSILMMTGHSVFIDLDKIRRVHCDSFGFYPAAWHHRKPRARR
jgi:hypothetical protein